MAETVLVLAKPTQGDPHFYSRWESFGKVLTYAYTDELEEVTILVVDQHTQLLPGLRKDFPSLKYVCSATTGHTHLEFDPDSEEVKLVTLRGEREFLDDVRSVSEFTLKLMLELARPLDRLGRGLNKKTCLIIGVGRIGRQVYDLACRLGMTCLLYDKESNPCLLQEKFEQSDFVTIHCDENPSSKGLISRELIFSMKPTAYLINTARGSIIDEKALAEALYSHKIAGAAVDVVEDKKVLHSGVPNLIITPHVAGSTLEDRVRTDEFIAYKLKGLLSAN